MSAGRRSSVPNQSASGTRHALPLCSYPEPVHGQGSIQHSRRPHPRAGGRRRLPQTRPAPHDQEPRHVRARGRGDPDDGPPGSRRRHGRGQPRLLVPDRPLALVHGAVRQFRGGRGRGAGQGAGREPAPHPHRDAGQGAGRPGSGGRRSAGGLQDDARRRPQGRRCRAGRSRRHHPVGRRGDRRRRFGQRGRYHGRKRARDPRVGRRPLRRDRRDAGVIRLDQGANHGRGRFNLHRSHDRARRRRRAAENAERDRVEHPARGADHHLRLRGRLDPVLRGLCGRLHPCDRARGALRDADPDHHRGVALGDRHRRHGPARSLQRAGDVGPRRRGCGRRRHAAARQDRDHHARQPAGDGVPPGAERHRTGTRRRGPVGRRWPTRRRKAVPSSSWPRTSTTSGPATWPA